MDKEFSNIRIVDIAKMAGVSVGTVDRVIHNRGRVSEENRKKVQTILEMVHYQPNLMARSLASKKQYHFVAITLLYGFRKSLTGMKFPMFMLTPILKGNISWHISERSLMMPE